MSVVKVDIQNYNGKKYTIYRIIDYTSPDPRVAMSVAYGIPLKNNNLQFLEPVFVIQFIQDMMDDMKTHEKVMVIIDITNFPIIAVSFGNTRDDLINDGTDIGIQMNKYYDQFTWQNKMFPLVFVNLNTNHTGFCVIDYDNKTFIQKK